MYVFFIVFDILCEIVSKSISDINRKNQLKNNREREISFPFRFRFVNETIEAIKLADDN